MSRQSTSCPACRSELTYDRFHAGFSNLGYMYCSRDEGVVTWDSYDRHYSQLVADKHPWMLNAAERERVEAAMGSCPFGGTFSFSNLPRCPRCAAELPVLAEEDRAYFVVLGRRLEASRDRLWRGGG